MGGLILSLHGFLWLRLCGVSFQWELQGVVQPGIYYVEPVREFVPAARDVGGIEQWIAEQPDPKPHFTEPIRRIVFLRLSDLHILPGNHDLPTGPISEVEVLHGHRQQPAAESLRPRLQSKIGRKD